MPVSVAVESEEALPGSLLPDNDRVNNEYAENSNAADTQTPPSQPEESNNADNAGSSSIHDLALLVSNNDGNDDNNDDALLGTDPNDPFHLRAFEEVGCVVPTSLARSPKTPCLAAVLIPILAIFTHVLFIYGQLAPMWRLHVTQQVDVWANATSKTSRYAFDTLGLEHEQHVVVDRNDTVREFTYGFAIQELWEAKKMPNKVLPRIAAILLVLFSGIWPHLKLLLLNCTWLASSNNPSRRSTTLTWLATLGKWSLADVLAVCVMVGVLNLDWEIDPAAIKDGVISQLPTLLGIVKSLYSATFICGSFLKYDCASPSGVAQITKCRACRTAIHEAFNHPDWVQKTGKNIVKEVQTSGGGSVKLAVVGMKGIYAFCGAVIVSVLLSLVVDVFDFRARKAMESEKESATPCTEAEALTEDEASEPLMSDSDVSEPLLHNHNDTLLMPMELDDGTESVVRKAVNMVSKSQKDVYEKIAPFLTLAIVAAAVSIPCMERRVDGAIPQLLHDILGITWERHYSLHTLQQTTGAAGSWDLLLMGTFGLFVVLGPLIRSLLVVMGLIRERHLLTTMISFVGAFCAWEVFVLAMLMVELLMPSITDTILHNDACAQIASDGSCLQVEFNTLPSFTFVIVGGILLLVTATQAIIQDKHRARTENLEDGSHYVVLNDDQARMEDVI